MRQHFEGRRPRPPPLVTVRTYSPSQTFRWNVWDERTFTGDAVPCRVVGTLRGVKISPWHWGDCRNVGLLSNVRTLPWRWGQLPQCQNLQGIDILSGFSILPQHRTSPWHWGLPQCRASAECRSAQIIKPLCGVGGQAAENGLHRSIGECRGGRTS